MEQQCANLANCGFFRKYETSKQLACRGFIRQYCKGSSMDDCKRKAYKAEHGKPPSDDMMPNGGMTS